MCGVQLQICDRLCINQPFTTAKHWTPLCFLHNPLTELLLITTMFFSIQWLIVLKLYDGKYDTVENFPFEKCPVSNFVFVLRLIIAQQLIASFSMNAYRVRGPNFARRCAVESRYYLWHKRNIDKLCPVCYFGRVLKIYILRWMVGLCIDGRICGG